jgi:voltage-gated sodium channel
MRDAARRLIDTPIWGRAILALIILNAIILGLETDATVMATIGPFLMVLDQVILALFVVEIALRLFVHRLSFFRDPWSVFDFAVVAIALIPATGPLQVLRALRILRVMRMLSLVPSLRRVVGGLVAALPGMASIVVLIALVFYVFAVMATNLFGGTFPDWFGSLGASGYTLFQIMTLESWSMGIVRPVMEAYPLAWLFFIPFILSTTYAVLNLFIGVIVSAMQHDDAEATEQHAAERNAEILLEIRMLRAEVAALRQSQD